ncbi:MAG: energy-coupling factor ABC transporter permease, partial [Campylobacter sp.]|nr:energy-coupling factor ABC transporter permease [Campylobacter sp.]
LLSSFLLSLVLALNGDEFFKVAVLAFGVNAGLALIEGVISLFGLSFIYKVKKEILP